MRLIAMRLGLIALIALIAAAAAAQSAGATTCHVANALGSHMVLQRDRPAIVWGFAGAGVLVTVSLNGVALPPVAADANGTWRAALPAQPATAAPSSISFECSDGTVPPPLEDVLFGDVRVRTTSQSSFIQASRPCAS